MTNFDPLLGNVTFMHSLWACAMEIVLFIYRVPWSQGDVGLGATGFPWILSVTDIQPYDFYKVCSSYSEDVQSLIQFSGH